jgi:hypothetical protein
MSDEKPKLQSGRPSAKVSKEKTPKVEEKEGIDRMNVHFKAKNARKLRLYAASLGKRPSAVLNELVEALEIEI